MPPPLSPKARNGAPPPRRGGPAAAPKPAPDPLTRASRWVQDYKDGPVFALTVDAAVLVNALVVGTELDYGGNAPAYFKTLRYAICGLYALELGLRAFVDGLLRRKLAQNPKETRPVGVLFFSPHRAGGLANCCEFLLVLSAFVDTFALSGPTILWRCTVLRVVRYLRIHKLAARWRPLTELWLVLMGLARASKALAWFFLLLICVIYGFGGAAAGLVDSDGIQDTPGFDSHEYFGSTPRSMLTLLQLATLDGWASSVVRPLAASRPFAACVLVVFAFVTAYGFMSVGVGVLVWSTVELAHKHEGHSSQTSMAADFDMIAGLTGYFRDDLWSSNREFLTKRDFQDAMSIPQLALVFRRLELPLLNTESLFRHIDHQRKGRITLEQFEKTLTNLKKPANRFDVACLTATLGGSSTSVLRLERRADAVLGKLESVKRTLSSSFAELNVLAQPDQETGQVPEVVLRRAGAIVNVAAASAPPRYTF